MKKMKRATSFFAISALAFGMLAACAPKDEEAGGNKASTDKEYDLLVWEDKDKIAGLEGAVAAFEKEHNVKVKVQEVLMTEQIEKLRLDSQSKNAPDVITIPHDQIGSAVVQGLITELNVEQNVVDTFTDSSIAAQTYEGKLYGLPKSVETPILIYNKDLMPEAPKTMDELYAFSKYFTKDGNYGFLALWDNFYFAHGPIAGMGGYVFGEENGVPNSSDVGLNNDNAVAGGEYVGKWYSEKLFPAGIIGDNGGSAMDSLFNEGKAAAVMNGPWSFQGYTDAGVNIGVAPMPTMPNGEPMKTYQGVKGWHVTSNAADKTLATKFVEFITNEQNAETRFVKTQEIPPVISLMEKDIIKNDEKANAVAQQSVNAIAMPNIPEMQEVWTPMASALQLIATGKQDAKAALNDAQKLIEANIQANHGK